MNWIDEKIYEIYVNNDIDVVENQKVIHLPEHKLRTALQEAHDKGAQEERQRVLEWAKSKIPWHKEAGTEQYYEAIDDLINFINKDASQK